MMQTTFNANRFVRAEALFCSVVPLLAYWLSKGFWIEALHRYSPALCWIADVFQYVALPMLGVAILARRFGIRPRDYGFTSFGRDHSMGEIALLFATVFAISWLAYVPVRTIAYSYLWQSAASWSFVDLVPKHQPLRAIAVVYIAITAAFVEEVVFRALPWLYLKARFPDRSYVGLYVFVTASLFASIHWQQGPHGVIAAFSLGNVSAYLYAKIQNIWPFVAFHFLIDLAIFW